MNPPVKGKFVEMPAVPQNRDREAEIEIVPPEAESAKLFRQPVAAAD